MATANRINLSPDRYDWTTQRAGLTVNGYMDSHPRVALACWVARKHLPLSSLKTLLKAYISHSTSFFWIVFL